MSALYEGYWLAGLAGGALIGLSATLLLWLNGRIAGISGIVGGAVFGPREERRWRIVFLSGLVIAGAVTMHAMAGGRPLPVPPLSPLLVVGGLLVGYGTSLGGGCTSGHGVCGIARLSKRSLIAVPVFIASAMLTVFVVRHVVGGVP